jgi:RHS repeat-associated protein
MRIKLFFSTLLVAASFLCFAPTLYAYNFSWSTHEDITKNDPDNDPGECSSCECEGPPDECPGDRKGSPVYLKTGHLSWDQTDIALPGRPSLTLKRSYSSHDPRTGLFGNGWISNFERTLVTTTKTLRREDAGDSGSYQQTYYIFRHPSGLRYTFKELEDGTINTPRGLFQRIENHGDGSYSFYYPDGSVEIYEDGRMILHADANGNSLDLYYDDNGLLESVENEGGSTLHFYYGANGYVGAVQDHTGRTWNYNYDTDGNLIEVVDPLGGSRNFSYSSYKPSGDAQIYYQLTNIIDAAGVNVIDVTYNGEQVSSYTEGQNRYSYTYNFSNRSAVKTDSAGSSYGYNWDENGLITRRVDPLGKATTIQRNEDLVRTGKVDEAGYQWTWEKDDRGRAVSSTSPLNQTTRYAYNGDNPNPVTITSPLGSVTTLTYNSAYNLTSITNALGSTTQFSFDNHGNIIGITDPLGNSRAITYNSFSLPSTVTDQLGRTTSYSYDSLGRLISITDAENRTTRFEYDELSRVLRTVNPLGHIIEYDYDGAGRLLSITDPVGNITTYSYDSYGRLQQETKPDGGSTVYSYNSDNTIASIVRPDVTTISFSYDTAKRLISENVGGDINTYEYDARGLLTGAANSQATVGFNFDAAQRFTSETLNDLIVAHSYDLDNNLTGLSYADESLTYTRNAIGQAESITSGLTSDIFSLNYDANSVLLSTLLPNGLSNQWSYNDAYEVTAINAGLTTLSYNHDQTGLITEKIIDGSGISYDYDAAQRLVTAGNTNYNHDIAGNIQNNGASYVPTNNRLLEDDTHSYNYDAAGNLTQKLNNIDGSRKVYTWNNRNQLLKVESFDNQDQLTREMVFTYGPLGRRLSKKIDGQTVHYLYDGSDIVAILDDDNTILSTIVHSEYIDTPLSITTLDTTYYYHPDHQGSILSLTDATQNEVENYSYDTYGATVVNSTETTNNPYAYTGREYDDTDLYYYRARYYDPTIGRFLSEDPIGFWSGDYNFYRYVQNDPVNFVDPYGLEILVCNRKVNGFPFVGNHAYPWDTTNNTSEGMRGSSGSGANANEVGPQGGDSCNEVEGSEGMEDEIMDFMRQNQNNGVWFPGVNDCHSAVSDAVQHSGLEYPGAPGGRIGEIPSGNYNN